MIPTLLIVATAMSARPDTARVTIPVAIERRFATMANLRVGDTVVLTSTASAHSVNGAIAAVYEPRADPATIMRQDLHVRLHLGDLATLLGQPDRVDRVSVALRPGVDVANAANVLSRTAFGYDVIPSATIASESSATFVVVSRFHRAIAIISVLASAIFLLCLMLLKVDARRRDVAMLRFTGISRRTIFVSLMVEAALIALVGSIVGVGLALVAGSIVNRFYQHAFNTSLIFSLIRPSTLLFATSLSIGLGIGAGALVALRLVRTAPAVLWNRAG